MTIASLNCNPAVAVGEEDILEDLFHGCAFAAFIEQAHLQQGEPCLELTRRLAYKLYEDALASRNQQKQSSGG